MIFRNTVLCTVLFSGTGHDHATGTLDGPHADNHATKCNVADHSAAECKLDGFVRFIYLFLIFRYTLALKSKSKLKGGKINASGTDAAHAASKHRAPGAPQPRCFFLFFLFHLYPGACNDETPEGNREQYTLNGGVCIPASPYLSTAY